MTAHDWINLVVSAGQAAALLALLWVVCWPPRPTTSVRVTEQCGRCDDHWEARSYSSAAANAELEALRVGHVTRWHRNADGTTTAPSPRAEGTDG